MRLDRAELAQLALQEEVDLHALYKGALSEYLTACCGAELKNGARVIDSEMQALFEIIETLPYESLNKRQWMTKLRMPELFSISLDPMEVVIDKVGQTVRIDTAERVRAIRSLVRESIPQSLDVRWRSDVENANFGAIFERAAKQALMKKGITIESAIDPSQPNDVQWALQLVKEQAEVARLVMQLVSAQITK